MARDGLTDRQRFWLNHIKSCGSSGMPARAYADRHGFDVQAFYGWKNKLKMLGVLSSSSAAIGQAKNSSSSAAVGQTKNLSEADGRPAGSAHSSAARTAARSADRRSASFVRAAVMPAEASPSSEPQDRPCSARIILANGITIDVPAGTAADALGALIVAAQQIATGKGGSVS